ncbi:unnamed protein product [Cuscuta europaea]|uniref:Uncharacterized protein n=2 Tax=Cuscuta europaea TaxID=41803 RepID=A0A9P0ZM82_CUSEU|nr:unnamed protein product [Cuscuta europaea]
MFPQDDCKISLFGCYVADGGDHHSIKVGTETAGPGTYRSGKNKRIAEINWIQLGNDHSVVHGRDIAPIPKLKCLKWRGVAITQLDVHVIVYETPQFRNHHYSLGYSPAEHVRSSIKKPMWAQNLYQKRSHIELNTVIQTINTAGAAKVRFESHFPAKRSSTAFHVFSMFTNFCWLLFATTLASLSTFLFSVLQSFLTAWSYVSRWSFVHTILGILFHKTCKNLEVRCPQLLFWPVFLQGSGVRCQPCVEYSEMAAFRRHFVWSSLFVDLLLGNVLGILLSSQAEAVCSFILSLADGITNHVLRTGCVWLMGNPAGFKLNAELAGVLGMVSLNVVQIWSTVWSFINSFLPYLLKTIAVCGRIFGLTTASALTIDIISLATFHLSALHWLLSLLYSRQIQFISTLWRFFRGRKWNPLRQRLDSCGYTVEQHVIGSLLFTPLFLLLPTVTAFYIFFTIINASLGLICIVIDLGILVIHVTPYTKVALWLLRKKRFPCGIWFEIAALQCDLTTSLHIGSSDETVNLVASRNCYRSSGVVLFLRGNYLSLREVVWPHYSCVFSAVSRSSMASSAYRVLTGKRISYTLGTRGLPRKLPWMAVPYKVYWHLCCDAILSCGKD